MKCIRRKQRQLLFAILPVLVAGQIAGPALSAPQVSDEKPAITAESIRVLIEDLRAKSTSWQFTDLIDRGRLAMLEGEWGQASAFFETSATLQGISSAEIGAAWFLQAMGGRFAAQDNKDDDERRIAYIESAELLNKSQAVFPNNAMIAANRVVAWKLAGDPLETMIAEQHLNSLDGSLSGSEEVAGLVEAAIVIVTVVRLGIHLIEIYDPDFFKLDDRIELVEKLDAVLGVLGVLQDRVEDYIWGPLPNS